MSAVAAHKTLLIDSARITDAGLDHLWGCTSLTHLELDFTNVGDDGLRALAELRQLEQLSLFSTKVTDAGVGHLRGLPLRELDLGETSITDHCVSSILRLGDLQELGLFATALTDAGLMSLTRMSGLRHIEIKKSQVTESGAEKFRAALPTCSVVY